MAESFKEVVIGVLQTQHGFSKALSNEIYNTVFNALGKYIISIGAADIRGFGKFKIMKRKARTVSNLITKGTIIQVPASYYVKFSASRRLKSDVNEEYTKREEIQE